ncbi:hypothetical protein BS78_10G197200 [Paspalum vaginatum]|nr:hypothetical protein BS78_10G197200 [Paspalum vaginatum]
MAGPSKRQLVASAASSASAAASLPEELLRHILLRLPSRSVLRLRAVCKDWLRLISEPKFASEHHALQPALPLVSFLRGGGGGGRKAKETTRTRPVERCVEAFDLRADEFRPVVRFAAAAATGRFHIRGSCDGLLILSFADRFYVCNPATHQWTRLPTPLRFSWFAGFYRHDPTGEYRTLFYRGTWPGTDYYIPLFYRGTTWPGTDYYILVADCRKGRGIGLPSEKHGYKFEGEPSGPPALLRGCLHWVLREERRGPVAILAFNTVTEVFEVMDPPELREHMSCLEVDGELAMFSCGERVTVVELWLLQDYENEICVCKHRVRLPAVKASTFGFDWSWRMFFMSEEGVVVVTPEQNLLHYDMATSSRLLRTHSRRASSGMPSLRYRAMSMIVKTMIRHLSSRGCRLTGGDLTDFLRAIWILVGVNGFLHSLFLLVGLVVRCSQIISVAVLSAYS